VRELRVRDAPLLRSIACDPRVVRHSWPPPATTGQVEQYIRWARRERRAGSYFAFAVRPQPDGPFCGLFEFRRLQPDFFRAEAGFLIAPEYWGTAIFRGAAKLIFEFAFATVGISRIEVRVSVENARSNAVLAKMGFRREGTLIDAFVSEGRYVDQHLWALSGKRPDLP
jgi:ribosomal-protein-alanine N-acetyltransferase